MTRKALARRIAEVLFNEPATRRGAGAAALLSEPQTWCTRPPPLLYRPGRRRDLGFWEPTAIAAMRQQEGPG